MLTPAEVLELEDHALEAIAWLPDEDHDAALNALSALTDALLRAVGAPRQPVKISKARLVEIEGWLNDRGSRATVDPWNTVYCMKMFGEWRYFREYQILVGGHWALTQSGPHPSLRAALEWPIVTRSDAGPVKWFEVES